MPYSFLLDAKQSRNSRDPIVTTISGIANPDTRENGWEWSFPTSSDCWVDPVNHVLMLKPGPMHPEWETTATGIYARLKKADWSIPTAAKWVDDIKNGGAASFVKCIDSTLNEALITTTTWDKNRGFFLGWYGSNWGQQDFHQLTCGWNSSASTAGGVALKFYAGGHVESYKDGELLERKEWLGRLSGQHTARMFVGLLLIPYRQRELLIYSSLGHGTSLVFDDILDDDPDPTITPAEKFWVKVESGAAEFQCAPLRYPTSGYCTSLTRNLKEPPPAGISPEFTYFAGFPGYGTQTVTAELVDTDGSTTFVADGTKTQCKFKMTLTSDGESTPYVYGAMAEFEGENEFTDDSEQTELLPYVRSATLDVPESAGGIELKLSIGDPDSWDPDVLFRLSNRAFHFLTPGGLKVIDGRTDPIQWSESSSDSTRIVHMTVKTVMKALENYFFPDDIPLDGLRFRDAFVIPFKRVGLTEDDLDIDDVDYDFPVGGPDADSGYSLVIKAGDKGSEWVERLRSTYAPLHNLDIVPTSTGIKIRLADDAKLGSTSKITLFTTEEAALSYWTDLGYGESDARTLFPRRAVRIADEGNIEPLANDVWVIGLDRRRLRPLIARKVSTTDIDPTIPPSLRGENHLGERRRFAWVDNTLTTLQACKDALELIYSRIAHRREMLEIEIDWLLEDDGTPLWRGDVVTIAGDGFGDYRIVAMRITYELLGDPDTMSLNRRTSWITTRYVLEKLGITSTACGHMSVGTTLQQMVEYYSTMMLESFFGPGAKLAGFFKLEPVQMETVP